MSILTCEQLSQCNCPFHSLSSNHPVCFAYVTKRRETLGTGFGRKGEKRTSKGPFCHLVWIFLVKPLANFRKNSPFLSIFLAIFVRIVTFNRAIFAVSFEFSPYSPFSLLRECLYTSRHFGEKHMYVHMSYLPCTSICSEFGPEGISIQLSTVLVSPRHVIPWYLSCVCRNVPSRSVVILVVPCYIVFTVTLVGDPVYLWGNLAGFWFKKTNPTTFP